MPPIYPSTDENGNSRFRHLFNSKHIREFLQGRIAENRCKRLQRSQDFSTSPQGKNYIISQIKSFLLFSTWNLDTFKNRRISETLTSVARHFAASFHDIWFCVYIQIANVRRRPLWGVGCLCLLCSRLSRPQVDKHGNLTPFCINSRGETRNKSKPLPKVLLLFST